MREENNPVSKLGYFLVGGGIGAVIALLFAPRSGRETRDIITQKAAESKEKLASAGRDVSDRMSGYVDKGKEVVNTQKEKISAALETGKQAYRDEKGKPQFSTE
jgi:gas vesicle protein